MIAMAVKLGRRDVHTLQLRIGDSCMLVYSCLLGLAPSIASIKVKDMV